MNSRTSDDEVSYGETSSLSPSYERSSSNIAGVGDDHDYTWQSKSSAPSPAPFTDEKGLSTGADSSSKSHGDSSLDRDNEEEYEEEYEPQFRSVPFEEESNKKGYPKFSEKDDQEFTLRDEWGLTTFGDYEKQIDEDISYDDIEDSSTWVSDAEKLVTSHGTDGNTTIDDYDDADYYSQVLPSVDEQFPEDEFAAWPSEIPPTSENDVDLVSQDEHIAARSENNSFRDSIDEESGFDDFAQDSDRVEPLRAEKQEIDDATGLETNKVLSSSSSRSSSSPSSSMFSFDGKRDVAHDSSKSRSKHRSSASESKVSSPSIFSSDQTSGVDPDSSKSISRDVSGSAGKILSSSSMTSPHSSESTDDMDLTFAEEGPKSKRQPDDHSTLDGADASFDSSKNILEETVGSSNVKSKKSANHLRDKEREESNFEELMSVVSDSRSSYRSKRSESRSRRRHRKPRGSRQSSRHAVTSSAKLPSSHSRVSTNESNLTNSEASEAQIPRIESNTPRSRPANPPPRKESSAKQRARKPGSDRDSVSSYQSEPEERSSYHSRGSKAAKGKSKNRLRVSTTAKISKDTSNSIRSREQMHAEKEGLQKPLSDIQVKRHPATESSFNPNDPAPNALNFSKSASSFLMDHDCGLKTKTKRIHATINNEGYKTLVRKAYYKLLELRPRLKYLLSLSEWLHVHMLLLYARIFDCELNFYSIVLPRGFQIAVPNKIMVFEPIAAVISSIGIVEEVDTGVTYIPVARSYRGRDVYKPHDKDDVTEFLEWTQYDWNSSWYQVEKARLERRKMAAEKNMTIPKSETQFDDAKLEEWQQLAVEKWLGWDEDLWFSYNQACYVLDRTGRFVSSRRDSSKHGSYAWLLPRHTNDTGTFVRVPRPNLSPDSWMIAVMLHMCALEATTTATWYYETNGIDNVQYLIDSFLGAAIRAR